MKIINRCNDFPLPVAQGKIPHRTMRDELEAIEMLGEEMPPSADPGQYMFQDSSEVDMDAYCDPNVDIQKLGVSVDEHTYFGEVLDRLGINPSQHSSTPVESPES